MNLRQIFKDKSPYHVFHDLDLQRSLDGPATKMLSLVYSPYEICKTSLDGAEQIPDVVKELRLWALWTASKDEDARVPVDLDMKMFPRLLELARTNLSKDTEAYSAWIEAVNCIIDFASADLQEVELTSKNKVLRLHCL